jgi:hypothetical protein
MSLSLNRLRHVLVLAALAGVVVPSVALADDKAVCVAAYEKTQTLRKQSKLRESREQALVCARDKCPKLVKADCSRWLEEVTTSLPTVVFAARDAHGHDRSDVQVHIDGAPLTEQLGQEVMIDPGPHTVRFEASGAPPIEQSLVVRAGEKGRSVTVTLPETSKPEPSKPEPSVIAASSPGVKKDADDRPLPVLVPVLGVLGVAAAGTGAFLFVTGSSQLDELRSTCAPHCAEADVDTLNLRYRIGAAAIGVGVVSLGVALWLYVTRPSSHTRTTVGLRF